MSWIPKYILSGGMYGGRKCPNGSLDWLATHNRNYIISGIATRGYGDGRSSDSGYAKWPGAYGMNWDLLRSYIVDHADDTAHDFDLLEIDVANPQGAQFYRQSIVIKLRITGHMSHTESGDQSLDAVDYSTDVIQICRREYPTPYSAYTDTEITSIGCALSGAIYMGGSKELGGYWTYFTDRIRIALGTFYFGTPAVKYWGIGFYKEVTRADLYNDGYDFGYLGVESSVLDTEFGGDFLPEEQEDPNDEPEPDPDNPNPGPGGGGGGGGEGDHVLPDGPILVPPIPGLGSCSPSWLRTYMMDKQDIDEFGEELVDPTPMQQLKAYFADPLDAIVGITLCPCIPTGPRYPYTPKIHGTPGYEFRRSFTVISSQYGIVDCGFVDMAPYWDNCFDFDPYTKISIFLPFIGFREINADEVMGGKIGVIYHVDVVTGDCVAFITISAPSGSIYGPMQEKVIGQHHGNCGIQVPIGRVSHDAAVAASLNLMTTFAGMAIGAAAGYAGLAAPQEISESQVASQLSSSTMTAVEGMKTKVERAGALGGNAGYMGNRKPYLIRQIPRQSKPDNYKQICGYPCNKEGPLSNFETGTLACVEDIQLNNIPAMETEREEIIQFLRGGVIL